MRAFWTAFIERVMSCKNCTFLSGRVWAETVSFPGIRAWRKSNLTILKLKIIVFFSWAFYLMGRYSWSILSPIWKFFDVISHPICSCTFQETIFYFVHSLAQNLNKQFQNSFSQWQVSKGCIQNPTCPLTLLNGAWCPQNWSLLDASVQKNCIISSLWL